MAQRRSDNRRDKERNTPQSAKGERTVVPAETRVIFKLPTKLHRAAKIRAIMQGVTLEEALTRLIRDWVGEDVLHMLDAYDAKDNSSSEPVQEGTPSSEEE